MGRHSLQQNTGTGKYFSMPTLLVMQTVKRIEMDMLAAGTYFSSTTLKKVQFNQLFYASVKFSLSP
jgi:hypothetical protein